MLIIKDVIANQNLNTTAHFEFPNGDVIPFSQLSYDEEDLKKEVEHSFDFGYNDSGFTDLSKDTYSVYVMKNGEGKIIVYNHNCT